MVTNRGEINVAPFVRCENLPSLYFYFYFICSYHLQLPFWGLSYETLGQKILVGYGSNFVFFILDGLWPKILSCIWTIMLVKPVHIFIELWHLDAGFILNCYIMEKINIALLISGCGSSFRNYFTSSSFRKSFY